MKMMKLMIATALVTGTLLGGFMESAEAIGRRGGHGYSGGSSDFPEVEFKFDLFDINQDGKSINDKNNRSKVGLFEGAIENFEFAIEFGAGSEVFSFSSLYYLCGRETVELTEPVEIKQICDSEDDSKQFKIPEILNLKAEIGNDPDDGKKAIIYSFVDADMNEVFPRLGEDVFGLFDRSDAQFTGFGDHFSLVLEDNPGIDKYQAINSLEYILSKDLFGKAYQPFGQTDKGLIFEPIQETINSQSVPESNSPNSLLALGSLGLGVLVKRKIRQN
ncbi:MAG: hypothetical protein F6K14_02495 [Symploca sp. SIO2C1]|nr:hypothetical protein [Symploca sp. SIO2C1]